MDSSCARSQAGRRKALRADIASASAAYSTITENDLIARMASLFLYLLLHYLVEADLSSKIKFPMQPSEKLIYCYHAESEPEQ
jgi:hypothetical protein